MAVWVRVPEHTHGGQQQLWLPVQEFHFEAGAHVHHHHSCEAWEASAPSCSSAVSPLVDSKVLCRELPGAPPRSTPVSGSLHFCLSSGCSPPQFSGCVCHVSLGERSLCCVVPAVSHACSYGPFIHRIRKQYPDSWVIIPLIPLVISVSCGGYLLGWALA